MYGGSEIHLRDCTALHLLYYETRDIYSFNALLDRGADFTVKNGNGQTVVHLMMASWSSYVFEHDMRFISAVLSAHVKFHNSTNPRDDNGFTHLHAACIANHVEALELFLDNGASVDEAVNLDAPHFAGYTPLHFAARFCNYEVARILVSCGTNVNAQTADGKRPLDLFIACKSNNLNLQQKEEIIKLLLEKSAVSAVGISTLHVACTLKNLTIANQFLDDGTDVDYAVPMKSPIFPGNTALHFAAENSIEAVKMLLMRGAKIEVANAFGKTPLDLCIKKYSFEDVHGILSCIQNLKETRLSDGQTKLLDLIAAMENVDQFKLFLENDMKDISAVTPKDSLLFPGCTILHLAVTFSKEINVTSSIPLHDTTIVKECLDRGSDLNARNARGQTPLHLAFGQGKTMIVASLLSRLDELDEIANVADDDGLSYLHIACDFEDEALVGKLLKDCTPNIIYNGQKYYKNIEPGSTPLHTVAANQSDIIAEMLLRRGADLHASDANGLAPIHWLLRDRRRYRIDKVLFDSLLTNSKDRVVDGVGLSYLHVACYKDDVKAVEKLLKIGSDVNAVLKRIGSVVPDTVLSDIAKYTSFTPLHMAVEGIMRKPNDRVLSLLLHHGADLLGSDKAKITTEVPGLLDNPYVMRSFFQVLWERDDIRKPLEDRCGLTKLHIACFLKNEKAVETALAEKTNVNAQVNPVSKIFAGCTPLHMLLMVIDSGRYQHEMNWRFAMSGMIRKLLDRGADVTIANVESHTPVHLFTRLGWYCGDLERSKNLLMKAQRNFKVNPETDHGMSHFHLACYWHEVRAIKGFLRQNSVDVNRPVGCFNGDFAGCTPLHMALERLMIDTFDDWTKLTRIVDIFLKHGADVAAIDVNGDTPLHKKVILRSPGMCVVDKLLSYGGDLKCRNIKGQTPIEMGPNFQLIGAEQPDYLTIFRKYDCKINSWNPVNGEGYIARIFLLNLDYNPRKLSENSEFQKFLESSDALTVDDEGRTAIHNVVSTNYRLYHIKKGKYTYAIESFVDIGIDIDFQDKSGQTALHYATRMENEVAVEVLLACGADINIVDNTGKSALSYAVEDSRAKKSYGRNICVSLLAMCVRKLHHLRIEVSELNQKLVESVQDLFDDHSYLHRYVTRDNEDHFQEFCSQTEMTKTLDVGTNSLTLFDFLSETKAVTLYPLFLESEKKIVDEFFKSIDYKEFKELAGIIKLQFKKMTTRLELIDCAMCSLRKHLGFSFPGLCEQILRFLSNTDLKNLIKSTISVTEIAS